MFWVCGCCFVGLFVGVAALGMRFVLQVESAFTGIVLIVLVWVASLVMMCRFIVVVDWPDDCLPVSLWFS